MTWKPARIADLDPETQRRAEENMNFWIGRGLPAQHIENTKTTSESKDLPKEDPDGWFKRGEDCPW